MNHAQLVLKSLEKTASAGLVATALEMATGAALGGALGIASARKGRQGDPMGPSDVSGAIYGGILGALAGPVAGSMIRSSAVRRGVADDSMLSSMAERISDLENMALHKKVKATGFTALQNRDQIAHQHFGVGFETISRQVHNERMTLHRQLSDAIADLDSARVGNDPAAFNQAKTNLADARQALKAFDDKKGLGHDFKQMQKDINRYTKDFMEADKLHSEHIQADINYQKALLEQRKRRKIQEQKERMRGAFGFSF